MSSFFQFLFFLKLNFVFESGFAILSLYICEDSGLEAFFVFCRKWLVHLTAVVVDIVCTAITETFALVFELILLLAEDVLILLLMRLDF